MPLLKLAFLKGSCICAVDPWQEKLPDSDDAAFAKINARPSTRQGALQPHDGGILPRLGI